VFAVGQLLDRLACSAITLSRDAHGRPAGNP